jgi:HrpA-like RNA helicase
MKMTDSLAGDGSSNNNNYNSSNNSSFNGSAKFSGATSNGRTVKFDGENSSLNKDSQGHPSPRVGSGRSYTREEILSQRQALPIYPTKQKLIEELKKTSTLILIGETGSGKTTQIPQYIYESRILGPSTIAITQVKYFYIFI